MIKDVFKRGNESEVVYKKVMIEHWVEVHRCSQVHVDKSNT